MLLDDLVFVWRCPACQRAHEVRFVVDEQGHRYEANESVTFKCVDDKPGMPVLARTPVWLLQRAAQTQRREYLPFAESFVARAALDEKASGGDGA